MESVKNLVKEYVKLIRIKPKMKRKEQKGRDYLAKFLRISPLSHALWRSCEALAFEKLDFKKPVLDIGCGFGEFAGVAFNKIEVGIDINKSDLNKAQSGKKYAKLIETDARRMPFKNNSFATIISVSVLEHIEDTKEVVKEAQRVLKKGGIFAFSVPTDSLYSNLLVPRILRSFKMESLGKLYFQAHCRAFKHVSLKSRNWWVKQLEANGFLIIQKQGTVSSKLLKLHELFLIFALPSQLAKVIFGKRLIISSGLRSKVLPKFFGKFTELDPHSDINMFFVAKKK